MNGITWRIVAALAAFLLVSCGGSTVKLSKLPGDAVVLAFGDSLTFGTGATPETSYPALLGRMIGRKVIAAGIPGEVSAAGLARLPEVLDEIGPKLLILCHGGNDMLRKLGAKQAAENIRAMVNLARSKGVEVMLLGVPSPGILLSTADHYDDIARDMKLPYEGRALAKILSDSALKADAAHPNAAGYQRLANAVAEILKKSGAL
ncbi:MAG: arylesterase [Betaproteobacteria bacterium]|nr:arylesterase [Betaproteobacteria bacterium]